LKQDQEKTKQTIVTGQRPAEKLPMAQQMRRLPTPAEAKLWSCLRAGHLQGLHFRRQQVIDGFIVDFYCHAAGLVIELDGAIHQQQADYDGERDRILAERGLCILRFSNTQIEQNCPAVLTQIVKAACD
jgi:very-short-patch-repair endonuclease